jgi:predicted negative regulator of RcsB-dependent stress response
LTESNNRIIDGISMFANRNVLFLIIGALIVAVGVLGYNLYQDRKQPEGLQINVGPNGLKIQGK